MDPSRAPDGGEPKGLWDDAELVIYTSGADHAEDPDAPYTPWGQALGLVTYSLWARFEDDEVEIPIYSASETGVWLSMSSRQFHPDPAEPVSDAFIQAVVNMVDEDVGEGWGDPTEDAFEAMSDVEKQLWGSTRWAFIKMESPEAAGVIDWCQKRASGAGEGEDDD